MINFLRRSSRLGFHPVGNVRLGVSHGEKVVGKVVLGLNPKCVCLCRGESSINPCIFFANSFYPVPGTGKRWLFVNFIPAASMHRFCQIFTQYSLNKEKGKCMHIHVSSSVLAVLCRWALTKDKERNLHIMLNTTISSQCELHIMNYATGQQIA